MTLRQKLVHYLYDNPTCTEFDLHIRQWKATLPLPGCPSELANTRGQAVQKLADNVCKNQDLRDRTAKMLGVPATAETN